MGKLPVFMCIFIAACSLAATGHPHDQHRDQQKEAAICQQLQARDPQAVQIFQSATAAMDEDNYTRVFPLFRQVVAREPNFDPAVRRLGTALFNAGQQAEGIKQIRRAVALNRTADNLASLAQVLEAAGEERNAPSSQEGEALALVQEANRLAKNHDADTLALQAEIAITLHQKDILAQTVRTMTAEFPHDMRTHLFLGLQAAIEQHWIKAENEIRQAQRLGMPAEITEGLLASGIHHQATIYRIGYAILTPFCLWLLGFPLLFIIGRVMSNITLSSIETPDPNVGPNPRELRLRSWYRYLISIAGSYYYLSIPCIPCRSPHPMSLHARWKRNSTARLPPMIPTPVRSTASVSPGAFIPRRPILHTDKSGIYSGIEQAWNGKCAP